MSHNEAPHEEFFTIDHPVVEIKLNSLTVEGPYLAPEETAKLAPPRPDGEGWSPSWWRVREKPTEAWRHGWYRWKDVKSE